LRVEALMLEQRLGERSDRGVIGADEQREQPLLSSRKCERVSRALRSGVKSIFCAS
jgi:hypothetical protein